MKRKITSEAASPPYLLVAGRDLHQLVPEAEIDADIGQNRPCERCGGRKQRSALDDEQDGQEQRQKPGNAEQDAAVERVGIDRVLVGFRCPQIKLRQVVRGQFRHEGDDAVGVERDAEHVRVGAGLAVEGEALARRDRGDARRTEIRPDDAGTHETVVGRHDQPVDLLVGRVGDGEGRPVAGSLAVLVRLHLDAAHDAVRAGRGRDLHAFALVAQHLHGARKIEGGVAL